MVGQRWGVMGAHGKGQAFENGYLKNVSYFVYPRVSIPRHTADSS